MKKISENKPKKIDKKKVCFEIHMEVFKKVNLRLVELHGNSFGYFTKAVEDGLKLWLQEQEQNILLGVI